MKPPSDRILTLTVDRKKSASRQGIVGPNDEPAEPQYECSCGARYYGVEVRDTCEMYHLINIGVVEP